MFWKSLIEGLLILGHWQVWIAAILYMSIIFVFLMITSKSADESKTGILAMLSGAALQSLLMGLMIAYLLPILLGSSSPASLSAIISLLWPIFKISLIAIVTVMIISIIPFIGSFIANSEGIQAFLIGIIIFRLLSGHAIEEMLLKANVQGHIYPGLLQSIGFLIIAAILSKAVAFGFGLISIFFEDTTKGDSASAVINVVLPVIGVLLGMIPLFMYSSYVRLSIINLTSKY